MTISRLLRCALLTVAVIGLAGCDDGQTGPDATGDTTPCDVQPTLASLSANYLGPSCANFSTCHKGNTPAGGLDLELDPHAAMVNVAAWDAGAAAAGKMLVVAGNADASFMVHKVEGTMASGEGGIMPFQIPEPLDPACRIKALRDWIDAGALK